MRRKVKCFLKFIYSKEKMNFFIVLTNTTGYARGSKKLLALLIKAFSLRRRWSTNSLGRGVGFRRNLLNYRKLYDDTSSVT